MIARLRRAWRRLTAPASPRFVVAHLAGQYGVLDRHLKRFTVLGPYGPDRLYAHSAAEGMNRLAVDPESRFWRKLDVIAV